MPARTTTLSAGRGPGRWEGEAICAIKVEGEGGRFVRAICVWGGSCVQGALRQFPKGVSESATPGLTFPHSPPIQGMFEPAMPDWSLEGSAKPGTPLMLPLPSLDEDGSGLDDPQKAAITQFREQVQCDLQYLYCHIIR